jgi:hypothetical protein
MDTRAILDHQYEAFSAGRADDVITDFADDAVLIRADAVFEGRDAIHAAYSEMFAGRSSLVPTSSPWTPSKWLATLRTSFGGLTVRLRK